MTAAIGGARETGSTIGEAPETGSTIGDHHVVLRDAVLDALRRRIVTGRYAVGERLTEDRLAADFGVSRNPVREALRVAAAEGFVTVAPRRGAVVADQDAGLVADLLAVRSRLEPLAARLAAERATPDDIAALTELLDRSRVAAERGDLAALSELNSGLHRRVLDMSGNRWLQSMATTMYHHVEWVFLRSAAWRATHSWTEHRRLVAAIGAADPDEAEAAAAEHVAAADRATTQSPPDGPAPADGPASADGPAPDAVRRPSG